MSGIRMRTVWLHVTLPGQGRDAADLNLRKYPTLEELADELVNVLDYFQLQQAVLMGEGVGATICAHFAIKHSNRCHGLLLLEPVVSTAGVLESMKYKFNRTGFMASRKSSLTNSERSNSLSISVTSDSQSLNENETFHLNAISDANESIRNVKNMSLFSEAFLNRTCLLDQIANLT
jgi:pimeloyl-ACP methyl ester carboxylesterase